ncbi:MAG: ABC transporter permease [Thermoguttaceae bacterium]|nr:ABC transporter permease [Thermoguttaceae bacterium]MDW8036680.1 ABC transporter permease subunit [Thermoguttaceae bacterium]
MLIGPVLTREMAVAPRRWKTYGVRVGYVGGLFGVAATAWLVLAGTQLIRNPGDMARFGAIVFQLLAVVQLVLVVFFSGLLSATAVAQEKDRRTLELLLLTRLANHELVLGKLLASVLHVLVVLAAGVPLFLLFGLWGGVSLGQVIGCLVVCIASAVLCGSFGATVAFWREKTLQSLAMTVLGLVLWIAFGELVYAGWLGSQWAGVPTQQWATAISPWRAILGAIQPVPAQEAIWGLLSPSVGYFLLVSVLLASLLNAVAIARVRVWNPPQPLAPPPEEEVLAAAAPGGAQVAGAGNQPAPAVDSLVAKLSMLWATALWAGRRQHRPVWDNPILWREICTWAYGRKILLVKLVYWLVIAGAAVALFHVGQAGQPVTKSAIAGPLIPVFLISLLLLNAQAVISMTTERDAGAMDLLLVSDLTPGEILFGKLGGLWYNGKDWVILPLLLCAGLWVGGLVHFEHFVYLVVGMLVLFGFVSVLGLHTGMTFPSSRLAIATSLATVFFLCIGVAVCMMIMVAFSGSFQAQLQPFLTMMVGGGLGLYVVMSFRTPSSAKALAAFGCPLATFYAITSFLMEYTLGVFLVVVGAYGFATAALLVPALAEFDVATGRTTAD